MIPSSKIEEFVSKRNSRKWKITDLKEEPFLADKFRTSLKVIFLLR